MNVFFLDCEQRPKEIFATCASTRFSFDKSLTQILHHRFCIAVRRLLSIYSVLSANHVLVLRLGETVIVQGS